MSISKEQKKKLKKLIRKVVIARDGPYCLKCIDKGGLNEKIQMSHIHSVGKHKGMEYISLNIIPLCYKCHFHWWHKEPIQASEWIKTILSKKRLDNLLLMSQTSKLKRDFTLTKLYLEQELNELEKMHKMQEEKAHH